MNAYIIEQVVNCICLINDLTELEVVLLEHFLRNASLDRDGFLFSRYGWGMIEETIDTLATNTRISKKKVKVQEMVRNLVSKKIFMEYRGLIFLCYRGNEDWRNKKKLCLHIMIGEKNDNI